MTIGIIKNGELVVRTETQSELDTRAVVKSALDARNAKIVTERNRIKTFIEDTNLSQFKEVIDTGSLQDVVSFVRGKIDAASVNDLASARAALLRMETAVAYAIALTLRR